MGSLRKKFNNWVKQKYFQIALFNIVMILLFLLRSAGYFDPYFVISVNFIIIFGLILAVPLLGANSHSMFFVALVFWLFAGFLRILNLDIWAERTGIYVYESLLIALILLFWENIHRKN